MKLDRGSGPRPWSGDDGARRLFATVRQACAGGESLPARLEAGLEAALQMLARDPELARRLTLDPYLRADEDALDAQREWIRRFADLLGEAAAQDPRASTEHSFAGSFLIDGVRFQIARLVLRGDTAELPGLLPSLLEALLAYYIEPGWPQALARDALDG